MIKKSQFRPQVEGFDFTASYRVERDGAIKVKLQALHQFQSGKDVREIAEMVLSPEKTFDYEGLVVRHKLEALQDVRSGGTVDGSEIQALLAEDFDCDYSLSGVYALLDRLNIVWIKYRLDHSPFKISKARGRRN